MRNASYLWGRGPVVGGGGGVCSVNKKTNGSFALYPPPPPPKLSGQITYSGPPNHGKYTIMGGYNLMGRGFNGKDPTNLTLEFKNWRLIDCVVVK